MNRNIRMRHYDMIRRNWDTYFPQTTTANILRRDNGGVLETWLHEYDEHVDSGRPHLNHAVSRGTHRRLDATVRNSILEDGYTLILTIHNTLGLEPQLNFNGSGYKYIINSAGERIPGGQVAGSIIMLVFSKDLDSWVMISGDNFNEVTKVIVPSVWDYDFQAPEDDTALIVIPGFDYNSMLLDVNYNQTVLRPRVDYFHDPGQTNAIQLQEFRLNKGEIVHCRITSFEEVTRRNNVTYNLEFEDVRLVATEDGQRIFTVPPEAVGANYLTVNYNQTVLRNGIDYLLNPTGSTFELIEGIRIMKDEFFVIRTVKMVETNALVFAKNWGHAGHYTHQLKTIHGSFVSEQNNVAVVPVPKFDRTKDEITVVRDNLVLIPDIDYTIDELDQIVLLNDRLDVADELHWTILQGSYFDTPNFFFANAKGYSGQHILLDISYETLSNQYMILVKLRHDLMTGPTIKCIDGPAEPILDCYGNMVQGGYKAGSYLWLVYDYEEHVWYSMSHSAFDVTNAFPVFKKTEGDYHFIGGQPPTVGDDHSIAEVVIAHSLGKTPRSVSVTPCEPPNKDDDGNFTFIGDVWTHWDEKYIYVGNTGTATSKFHWVASLGDDEADLKQWVTDVADELRKRPGNIIRHYFVYENKIEHNTEIEIPEYDYVSQTIMLVNFGQTILRQDMDYDLLYNTIQLKNFYLNPGDIIQIMYVDNSLVEASKSGLEELRSWIFAQVDELRRRPGNIIPHYYEFVAPKDDVTRIVIPDFDRVHYTIMQVNYGQTILQKDRDYESFYDGIELTSFRLAEGNVVQIMYFENSLIEASKDGFEELEKWVQDSIHELQNRPGNIIPHYYTYTATKPGKIKIRIPNYDHIADTIVLVNYGRTVLRNGIDYREFYNGIDINTIDFKVGDIIQIVYVENSLLPATESGYEELRDWIAELSEELRRRPGNIYVHYWSYTVPENGVTEIPIDGYNHLLQTILMVNYGQTLLRKDLDYTEQDDSILIKDIELKAGDVIQFMFLDNGAMEVAGQEDLIDYVYYLRDYFASIESVADLTDFVNKISLNTLPMVGDLQEFPEPMAGQLVLLLDGIEGEDQSVSVRYRITHITVEDDGLDQLYIEDFNFQNELVGPVIYNQNLLVAGTDYVTHDDVIELKNIVCKAGDRFTIMVMTSVSNVTGDNGGDNP